MNEGDYMSFLEKYSEVFDSEGQVKLCGRQTCKELIIEAQKLDKSTDFGSTKDGFMNVKNIKSLYKIMTTK